MLEPGEPGQLDVLADGEKVAGRSAGFLARVMGGGFPDATEVVQILRRRRART